MKTYSGYNIIPIGDHCAISMILKDLKIREKSYPFDWVANTNHLYDTNIMYNIQIMNELNTSENVDEIVNKYIGNAFENGMTNSVNNIWFPHDNGNITDVFEKYKKRFIRLKQDLNKKNIFILLTRHYYIEKEIFEKNIEELLNYNNESIILFISGTNHTYFENMNYKNVIFKYIEYDIKQFFEYDYSAFRPKIKHFLSEFL
jgi:hypothetical protein